MSFHVRPHAWTASLPLCALPSSSIDVKTRRDAKRNNVLAAAANPPRPVQLAVFSADALEQAVTAEEPVVLRSGWSEQRVQQMREQFEQFAQSETETWQTQGYGKQTIQGVWQNGWRLEHNLEAQAQSTGPLDALLANAGSRTAAGSAFRTLQALRDQAKEGADLREPCFVTGKTDRPSLALLHYDDYLNRALVLVGKKTFHMLPPTALDADSGAGAFNERFDVTPANRPELPWRVAMVEPGDVFVLPPQWWHHVESDAGGSVMINVWTAATGSPRP